MRWVGTHSQLLNLTNFNSIQFNLTTCSYFCVEFLRRMVCFYSMEIRRDINNRIYLFCEQYEIFINSCIRITDVHESIFVLRNQVSSLPIYSRSQSSMNGLLMLLIIYSPPNRKSAAKIVSISSLSWSLVDSLVTPLTEATSLCWLFGRPIEELIECIWFFSFGSRRVRPASPTPPCPFVALGFLHCIPAKRNSYYLVLVIRL